MKRTIHDVSLKALRVLLRVDFNVPLDDEGNIIDDKRILAALPTIRFISKQGARLIICSHLGRPDGVDEKFSLLPCVKRLREILNNRIYFASDVVGKDAFEKARNLHDGEILVLENVRFEKGEEENDIDLSKKLASMADFFVNDAFGTAHRKHASTYGVARLLPNAMGFLMGKEVNTITEAIEHPKHPFVGVIGGAKIKDKIEMVRNLAKKVDTLLVGGGMAYTFLKAQGYDIGSSLVDDESIDLAKETLDEALRNGKLIMLPVDHVCAKTLSEDAITHVKSNSQGLKNLSGFDIGPKTRAMYSAIIKKAKTAIWNGPMGVFEIEPFSKGTTAVANAFARVKGTTIVGGGDSASALKKLGLDRAVSHLSTGGGASLMLFEGVSLPCVDVIADIKK